MKEEELSEAVLGRLAGTDYASMHQMTRAMTLLCEQRRDVISVLQISNPLVEKDIKLGWERLKLDEERGRQRLGCWKGADRRKAGGEGPTEAGRGTWSERGGWKEEGRKQCGWIEEQTEAGEW